MRGKLLALHISVAQARIIPARAGQTAASTSPTRRPTDHPRACGANRRGEGADESASGSSPRVRGKLGEQPLPQRLARIIPARAGQTPFQLRFIGHAPDHPRACGANSTTTEAGSWNDGSSPRVRGKRRAIPCRHVLVRIIPARAGQTAASGRSSRATPDHPRACGANPIDGGEMLNASGSSPRVRGKPVSGSPDSRHTRIIPARAGQTRATHPNRR